MTVQPHTFEPSSGSTRCAVPGCGSPRLALIHATQQVRDNPCLAAEDITPSPVPAEARDPLAEVVIEALRERVGAFHEQLLAAGFSDPAPAQIGVIAKERDKLLAEVERLRAEVERLTDFHEALLKQRDALADALLGYTTGDDCGCSDGSPDQPRSAPCVYCSSMAALQKAGRL